MLLMTIHHKRVGRLLLAVLFVTLYAPITACSYVPSLPNAGEDSPPGSDEPPVPDGTADTDAGASLDGSPQIDNAINDPTTPIDCVFTDLAGGVTDYTQLASFLAAGQQSHLPDDYLAKIESQIDAHGCDTDTVAAIISWKSSALANDAAGGAYVGVLSAVDILERGVLTGCHDHALILSTVLRGFGLPSIMVDAAGIQWAHDFSAGTAKEYVGHVFVEVYTLDNRWVLVDSTSGRCILNYNPCYAVIPLTRPIEPAGYYALLKGPDPAGYGVAGIDDLKACMEVFASMVDTLETSIPPCQVITLGA